MAVMGGEEALDRMKAIRPGVPGDHIDGYGELEAAHHFAGKDMAGLLEKALHREPTDGKHRGGAGAIVVANTLEI